MHLLLVFFLLFCAASSSPCLRVPVDNTVKMSDCCPDLSPTCLGANPQRSNMLRQFVPQEKREAAAPTILAAEVIIVIRKLLTLTEGPVVPQVGPSGSILINQAG